MFEAAFPANDELFISMVVRRIGPVDLLHFCLADTENSKKLVHGTECCVRFRSVVCE
jgi:hypothetical protein